MTVILLYIVFTEEQTHIAPKPKDVLPARLCSGRTLYRRLIFFFVTFFFASGPKTNCALMPLVVCNGHYTFLLLSLDIKSLG